LVVAEEKQLPSMAVSAAQLEDVGGDVALSLHGGGGAGVESLFLKRQGTMRGAVTAVTAEGSAVTEAVQSGLGAEAVVAAEEKQLPSMAVSAAQLEDVGGDVALSLHGGGGAGVESLFLKRQGTMRGAVTVVTVTAEDGSASANAMQSGAEAVVVAEEKQLPSIAVGP
jgi:hypothetical protein